MLGLQACSRIRVFVSSLRNLSVQHLVSSFMRDAIKVLTATLAVLAAYAGNQGFAQTARAPHSISGVVLDTSGAAIVSADVVLKQQDSVLFRTRTDNAGAFHFDDLQPGSYLLVAQAPGFRETTTTVNMGGKPIANVRLLLPVFAATEEVGVHASTSLPQVGTDAAQNQNANTIDRDALDRVPVFDQDYITTMSRFLDDSATGTNGVTLVVNGIEANGPGVTASAIQEVKINQNPYSVFFARPGRARLEIVTKSGTPRYHGLLNFMFRDAVFDARNAFAPPPKPLERRQYYEGVVTGPLGQNKRNTFLLSLDGDLNDQQAAVVATTPTGTVNENVLNPTHHFFGSGRVFHDRVNGDRFWIGYSYERRTVKNQGVGGTTLPSAGTDTEFQEHEVNVSYQHIFSTHWINQLHFLLGHYDAPVMSISPDPQIIVSGAFTGGGAQADSRRTEYHFDGTDFFTFSNGKHTMNFGVDIPDISRRGFDDFTNRAGTFTYGSLADYEAGNFSTFLFQRGQGHVVFLEKTVAGFFEDNIRLKPNFSIYLGVRYYYQNFFHDDPNNFAPRVAFAYAPTATGKTVIRGGGGVFYDRTGPSPIADLLHFNGVNLLRFIITPGNPAPPTSVVFLDPHAGIPYSLQYSFGIERQVTTRSTLSATFVGSRGVDLFRSIDANAPLPGLITRPNLALGQERFIQDKGYQKGAGLEVTFRGKPSRYFTGQVQYTFGKTYNNTSGITYFPANSYDAAADWARSDNDRRHKFDLLGSTQPTKYATFGVALSLYTGKPVNVTTGSDNNHDGVVNDRPPGYARNSMPGPGVINLDLNAEHDFPLSRKSKEARTLTVAVNAFNVLNHPNYVTYVGVITSPYFGRPVAAQPQRRIQLNLQFKF
jgi:hypothetical protein